VYPAPEGRSDAEAEELGDGDPRSGAAGSALRNQFTARKHLPEEAGEEWSAPSSQGARKVAPRRSRSSAKGGCREDGAHEEERSDARGPEGEDDSPPSQASAWSRSSTGIEEEGGLMAKTEEPLTQLATRIPKDLHRRLKLHCVTKDIMVQDFVVEAIEEKLGRKAGAKRG